MNVFRRVIVCMLLCAAAAFARAAAPADSTSSVGTPFAQGLFRYAAYGRALAADIHPDFVRFDAGSATNRSEWDRGQTGLGMRPIVSTALGVNLPIWRGDIRSPQYGLCVSAPVLFTLWLDLADPVTAPVVDTDYRVGMPVWTFIHRLNRGFATNYSVSWAPFKHESTHLGDELVLQHADHELPLRRVNVSYNYTELIFTLNEPEDLRREYHSLRAGLIVLWNWRKGWYTIKEDDGDKSLAQPRLSPWEAYVQYQYQSRASRHGFQALVSAEVRNRALYGYPEQDWSAETGVSLQPHNEGRVFTYNIFAGARWVNPWYDGLFGRAAVGVRAYHGNNPFGQFRNYRNYNNISLCIIIQ